jgi:YhcH/YjgK/YiaL family protein
MIVCPFKDIGRYAAVIPGLEEAVQAVAALQSMEPATVPLSGGNKILVQQGTTKAAQGQLLEAHREYLDIQYIVKGAETVGWAPVDTLTLEGEFNTVKDKGMYSGHCDFMDIAEGYCYVVFPEDAHMPGSHLDIPSQYQKLVIKLKV